MARGWLKVGLLAGVSLLGLGGGVLLGFMTQHAPLPAGFQLGNISLKGIRPAELTDWLTRLDQTLGELPVQAEQAPQAVSPLRDWGVRLDILRTYEDIRQRWSQVPAWQKLVGNAHAQITPHWQVDESVFRQRLQAFRWLERVPRDARVRFREGIIEIIPEQLGQRLSVAGSCQNLLQACQASLTDSSHPNGSCAIRFSLALEPVMPRITREVLQPIEAVVASYTTRFPGYQVNRNHNIRLAAAALDGRILLPGERLSYNEAVGERTLKQGFRLAPIIIHGQKRLGVGGGICQVSSTLFNAALLADLKIVRRVNHSIPVPYVPLGRDATVSDTGLDLVIENTLPHPVALSVEVGRSHLTVRVLGKPMQGRKVVLHTRRLRSSPMRVALWRLVYQEGRLIRHEHVATSTYRPWD
ncbi:Vancomycin B-type resistance protein VanW [bacterium HR15]|nr:Vancomycin B-type resistance protein VanW [bacterium HR15]